MNAILLLSSPQRLRRSEAGGVGRVPANDEVLPMIAPAGSPEAAIAISFVGLTPDEQHRALASFPGARRCLLAGD
ncbi:MAG TPA: hypothetical protein VL418_03725 [Devosiaceae bacterium]|jgi:hypothetical protein|nr:hypothetical protein [Devosiaceae bacterium]